MKNRKSIFLTIITENQVHKTKAEKLSEILENELEKGWLIFSIDSYDKFENSYKIEFRKSFIDKTNEELNLSIISTADRIASPWLVYFDRNQNTIELIFNKGENNRIRRKEFNVIQWGQINIVE